MATDILNAQEQEELFRLGDDIQKDLSCDANGGEGPCRTDRLSAVENMKRYLEIHGFKIKEWDGSNYPEINPLGEDV